jgi:hypothetical protein
MRAGRIDLLAGLLLVTGGCSGRLTFDPSSVDDAGLGQLSSSDAGGSGGSAPAARSPDAADPYGNPAPAPADAGAPDLQVSSPPTPDAAPVSSDGPSLLADAGAARDSGSPTGADGPPPVSGSVSGSACPQGLDVLALLKTKCGACHGAASPAVSLDLVSAGLAGRLIDRPSMCKDRPYIDGTLAGGQPTGFLFDKLLGPVAGCGVQMPAGASPLAPVEMTCLQEWVVNQVNGR